MPFIATIPNARAGDEYPAYVDGYARSSYVDVDGNGNHWAGFLLAHGYGYDARHHVDGDVRETLSGDGVDEHALLPSKGTLPLP